MTPFEKFVQQLDAIPWFANLGKPSPRDPEVFRISHWDTWPGPEDPGSEMQSTFRMEWRDELFKSDARPPGLPEAWAAIQDRVLHLTKPTVGYDDDQDTWFGPNAAVVDAAFMAALVGCTILKHGNLEEANDARNQWTLSNEWSWFRAGHWPCMYYWPWGHGDTALAHRTGGAKVLVIY